MDEIVFCSVKLFPAHTKKNIYYDLKFRSSNFLIFVIPEIRSRFLRTNYPGSIDGSGKPLSS